MWNIMKYLFNLRKNLIYQKDFDFWHSFSRGVINVLECPCLHKQMVIKLSLSKLDPNQRLNGCAHDKMVYQASLFFVWIAGLSCGFLLLLLNCPLHTSSYILVIGYLFLLWNCIYLALYLANQLITNKLDQQKQGIVSISDPVWPTWFEKNRLFVVVTWNSCVIQLFFLWV